MSEIPVIEIIIQAQGLKQTPADLFVIIAPEFKDIDYTGALAVADMQIAADLCGDKRPLLVAYLAAHILTLANPTGTASGSLASVTEGGTSITYKNNQASTKSTGLASTKYGEEYDRLSRGCTISVTTRPSACGVYPWGFYGNY